MSIRSALILAIVLTGVLGTGIMGYIGVRDLHDSVLHEAQTRVDHDMRVVWTYYRDALDASARRLGSYAQSLDITSDELKTRLAAIRKEMGLAVLNVCDSHGQPVAGTYSEGVERIPVSNDPVIRRALEGKSAHGTVLLTGNRLKMEGGVALQNALRIPTASDKNVMIPDALLWWFAVPILDSEHRVVAVAYGGRALNYNNQLVDTLRSLVVGQDVYEGKPLGTVTIFMRGVRVATNVLGPDRARAVGTFVSAAVQEKVLQEGQTWSDRAWVVDSWYLSAYQPLRDPDGRIVGMLYVGLLESPYNAMQRELIMHFLTPVLAVGAVALVVVLIIVGRITRPLRRLSVSADRLAQGDWTGKPERMGGYAEISHLENAFVQMHEAIEERDLQLRSRNAQLAETNDELEQANSNYMKMLGFITHELKSPLSAIQTIIDTLLHNLLGEVPERMGHSLVRIKRNCEELQDMVKNYLDLSRAERGELVAHKTKMDLRTEVVEPAVATTSDLLKSRNISLEVDCPENITVKADPELLRITLSNYLSNAAKYGTEGGKARVEVSLREQDVRVCVFNEGQGFTPEEGENLFQKFSRIRNKTTRDKRGSGLGLFLCKQIIEQHGGKTWAESEPTQWARFLFTIPRPTTVE